MAVDDTVPHLDAVDVDGLVARNPRFYPVSIPISHWQLRNFISVPDSNTLVFVSKSDIYSLDLSTKSRTHISALPFAARCFAAGHSWACAAGGNAGDIVIVKLDETNFSSVRMELDSDLSVRPLGQSQRPRVRHEKIGEEIINSITLHKLHGEEDEEDVVAVLTNNDRSVTVYSLTHGKVAAKMELPFATNHATLSPDGTLMVTVGDYNQAYFFERTYIPPLSPSKGLVSRSVAVNSTWELINVVQLARPKGRYATPAYFSTAWSPSGALCAVASEAGYTTILDTELLKTSEWAEDAIVEITPSTRPGGDSGPGSIRAMCFSAQPWDLLVWTEDHGRACVGDLRSGMKYRQVLTLDPETEGVQHMEFADNLDDTIFQREMERMRGSSRVLGTEDGPRDTASVTRDYMEILQERHRHEQSNESLARATGERVGGLTSEERQILQALRTTRQRLEENERALQSVPRSINYNSSRSQPASSNNPYPPLSSRTQQDLLRIYNSNVPTNNPPTETTTTATTTSGRPAWGSLRDLLRERNRSQQERLNSLSHDQDWIQEELRRRRNVAREMVDSSSNSSGSSGSTNATTEDPWVTIQAALASTRERNRTDSIDSLPPLITATASQAAPLTPPSATSPVSANAVSPQRAAQVARARRLAQETREHAPINATHHVQSYADMRSMHMRQLGNPADGPRTTGLAMSPDGRKLFVGTEQGIWEWEVNWRKRGMWESVDVR